MNEKRSKHHQYYALLLVLSVILVIQFMPTKNTELKNISGHAIIPIDPTYTPEIIPEPQEIILGNFFTEINSTWAIMKGNNDDFNALQIKNMILNKTGNALDLPIIPLGTDTAKKIIIADPTDSTTLSNLAITESIDITSDVQGGFGQGYVIKITEDKIIIFSNTSQGRFYGTTTLYWLLNYSNGELIVPQLRINDWPDLEIRGISTVLSYPTEEEQIDYLAKLKYNLWIEKPTTYIRNDYSLTRTSRIIQIENYLKERHFLSSLKLEPQLYEDNDYKEGHYAKEINFVFDNNDKLISNGDGFNLLNNGFELDTNSNNIPDDYNIQDVSPFSSWNRNCVESIEGSCSAEHKVTSRLFSGGDIIQTEFQQVKSGGMYLLEFFAKSQGQKGTLQAIVDFNKNSPGFSNAKYITIENLSDEWTKYTGKFWLPDNVIEIRLNFRSYQQESGSFFVDNVTLISLDEQLLNVLNNPSSKLKITSLDKTKTYTEGIDYSISTTGTINSRHPLLGEKTIITRIDSGSISPNEQVLVSYDYLTDAQIGFTSYSINDGTSEISISEDRTDRTTFNDPEVLRLWEERYIIPTYTNLTPDVHMFWLDEIRGMNRDSRRTGKENYEVLANHVNNAYNIVKRYNQKTKILMWEDMISPFHNGRVENYQTLYNGYFGATRYASQIINKNIIPVIWWYNLEDKYRAMTDSIAYFNSLGFTPMVAGYENENNTKWWSYQCTVNQCSGYITTDWNGMGKGIIIGANYSWNSYEPDFSSCNPEHLEICDGVDNDCDAKYYQDTFDLFWNTSIPKLTTGTNNVDENYDLQNDEFNCGACGNICNYEFGKASCNSGTCQFEGCLNNYYDNNSDLIDGCEYYCEITNNGIEIIDLIDNNCNGIIDEAVEEDIDEDGDIDFDDATIAISSFRAQPLEQNYNPRADVNKDGVINIIDIVQIIINIS